MQSCVFNNGNDDLQMAGVMHNWSNTFFVFWVIKH